MLLALIFALPSAAYADLGADTAKEIANAAGDSRLVILGEMHGTREIPDLVAVLAERYAAQGPLVLALEMERTEHDALARYMASDGAVAARDELRRRPYWNIADGSNDGRRSVDMLDLIESMRVLKAAGRDVAISPYDKPPGSSTGEDDRERTMANYLHSIHRALPRGRILVLTGNLHATLQPLNLPGIGTSVEPMAYHLRELQPYSIKISAGAGEIWGCRSVRVCGPIPYSGSGKSGPWRGSNGHYHYQVVLPAFSAAQLSGGAGLDSPWSSEKRPSQLPPATHRESRKLQPDPRLNWLFLTAWLPAVDCCMPVRCGSA